MFDGKPYLEDVSIHAPTKGATDLIYTGQRLRVFQSTLLRKERRKRSGCAPGPDRFNPRSYERSDKETQLSALSIVVSIHAPTKGATCNMGLSHCNRYCFNPRSYERSDSGSSG